MDEALSLITQTLGLACCEVLEGFPPGGALRLPAGLGWQAGLVGRAIVDGVTGSQAGHTPLSGDPVIVIETLKISQSFVADIHDHSTENVLVAAIITMGHCLGLNVVAESVETEEQMAFLKSQDCDELQGFLLGRPVPAEDFVRSLAD